MLIAGVQSDVSMADPEANLARVLRWMKLASSLGDAKQGTFPAAAASDTDEILTQLPAEPGRGRSADLLVFPECMLTGYAFDSRQAAMDAALPLDGPAMDAIGKAAAEFGQFVSVGFLERDDKRLFNAAALVGPQGTVAHYRKIHLPGLGVDRFVNRGDQPYVVHTVEMPRVGRVNVGLGICYDSSFPEPMRVLGLLGADVIALGTNWPAAASRTAEIVPPARSMENHLYFVAANRVGCENSFTFCGKSTICGPDGVVLARSDDVHEALLWATGDPALARNKRIERTPGSHVIDRFADRRPEHYGEIARRL